MCIKEFLAYQCGHRSVTVVRPCPMTTTGHNYPVCTGAPERTFYAETMCASCERQLHSRWVLIREWEHRWLHERGVCGCDVIFPGLLNHPRVIGDTAAPDPGDTTQSDDQPPKFITDAPKESSTALALAKTKDSKAVELKKVEGKAVDKTSSKKPAIPALFKEEVTDKGEHHVAVRLPGLYAAEWQADHTALHKSSQCNCAAGPGPSKPNISVEDMTPTEQDNLRRWHQLEEAPIKEQKGKEVDKGGNTNEKIDETVRRINEITKEFGKFTVDDPPSKRGRDSRCLDNKSQCGRSTHSNDSGVESYIGSDGSTPHGRRIAAVAQQKQHHRMGPYARRVNTSPSTQHQHGKGNVPHLILESQPTAPYHPYTFNPFQTTTTSPSAAVLPPHLQPHYFTPAHPRFATAATFTDTIPHGAYPWATQIIHDHNERAHGPGPFTTAGFTYPTVLTMGFLGPPMNMQFHVFDTALATATAGNSRRNSGSQAACHNAGQVQGQHGAGFAHTSRELPTRPGRSVKHQRYSMGPGTAAGPSSTTGTAEPAPHNPAGTAANTNFEASTSGRDPDTTISVSTSTPATATGGDDTGNPNLTICGLPVGAGPEGTLHMPSWTECRLRKVRSASESAVTMLEDEEYGEDGHEEDDVPGQEHLQEEFERWIGGGEEGIVEEESGEGVSSRRPALQRRYSAET
ncbi:hypothetical protein VTJ49DRAFT_735 [Mycothermus thermophilus]|uniref:Uncharacterized protein n=1 Tax=Humicola insolens TaxID=85995 RepID=A0ABR3VFG2_HUMIN